MYAVNFTSLIAAGITEADPSWPISECQHGWEYEFTDVPYTSIATEVGIVGKLLPTVLFLSFFYCLVLTIIRSVNSSLLDESTTNQ